MLSTPRQESLFLRNRLLSSASSRWLCWNACGRTSTRTRSSTCISLGVSKRPCTSQQASSRASSFPWLDPVRPAPESLTQTCRPTRALTRPGIGTCTLREAHIICGVLTRVSIPVLHSAAAIKTLCDIAAEQASNNQESVAATNMLLKILLEKKYALRKWYHHVVTLTLANLHSLNSMAVRGLACVPLHSLRGDGQRGPGLRPPVAARPLPPVHACFCRAVQERHHRRPARGSAGSPPKPRARPDCSGDQETAPCRAWKGCPVGGGRASV